MKILSFDIEGKFAHFRKFHGNNTALSYSIPPRTTIIGIIAAIMGEEKDSYYEKYNHQNLKVGIRVLNEIKKTFHRLNLLMIKTKDDFTGRSGRVQTPFEVVTGNNLRENNVAYRIYLAAGDDPELFETICSQLEENRRKFNLTLGTANFIANISNLRRYDTAIEKIASGEWIELHSACNSDQISEIQFPDNAAFKFNHIEEELMPADFVANGDREVFRMNRVLFATTNMSIHAKLNGPYFELQADSQPVENIQFLEYAGVLTQS